MVNPQEDLLRRMMSEVTDKLTEDLRSVLADTIERQISTALTQSLLESEFYRRISKDMRSGLKRIYKEISVASQSGNGTAGEQDAAAPPDVMNREEAAKLFHEASEQLNAVLSQTEEATEQIMEIVERHMDLQGRMEGMLDSIEQGTLSEADSGWLRGMNTQVQDDLNQVLMALSFQDLTGQRIKRAVKALQEIESTVVELYLSTGLLIQAYEEAPEKDLDMLEMEAKRTVDVLKGQTVVDSELKGPSSDGVSQKNIDDLLAQLGMD